MFMDPIIFNQFVDRFCYRKNTLDGERIRVHPARERCSDCLQVVAGRVVEYSVWKFGTDEQCWRKNCSICLKKTFI